MAAFLPWTVEEAALAITGERLSAKFTRTGDLLMFPRSRSEADLLQTVTEIGGVPVAIVRPPHLNRAQGSIWAPELVHHSPADLAQGFASQGVTEVFRPRNERVLILTFDSKRVPDEITAAFLVYPVRPIVPLPRRCTKCQRYGHKAPSCRASSETCAMCGGGGHSEPFCEATAATCPSCGGPHSASDPLCPTWLREKRVQALISEGWAPGDARRRAEEERGEPPRNAPPPAQAPRPRLSPGSMTDLRRYPPLEPQAQLTSAARTRPPPASQSGLRTAAWPRPPPAQSTQGPPPPAPPARPTNPNPDRPPKPKPKPPTITTGAATPSRPPPSETGVFSGSESDVPEHSGPDRDGSPDPGPDLDLSESSSASGADGTADQHSPAPPPPEGRQAPPPGPDLTTEASDTEASDESSAPDQPSQKTPRNPRPKDRSRPPTSKKKRHYKLRQHK